MQIQKLTWAGIGLYSKDTTILIDPLGADITNQDKPFVARVGDPLEGIISFNQLDFPDAILITHTHADHFDPESILSHFGRDVPLYVPLEAVRTTEALGFLNVIGVRPTQEYTVNNLRVVASFASDGFGTPQVSWIVSDGIHTVFHNGDTQWHGYWWHIEQKYGPIHIACLPVNGPLLEVKGLKVQSELPACLTPEQAVEAANILQAELIPIHYATFNNPPYYSETNDVKERLLARGKELGVQINMLNPKDTYELSSMIKK